MPDRIRHALRFASTTLVAVYVVGLLWVLVDVYVRGRAAPGLGAAETFRLDERQWRLIALVVAVTVLLLRLGDVHTRPPTWRFAWAAATWLGVASIAAAHAIQERQWALAAGVVLAAVAIWMLLHRRMPGWPGHADLSEADAAEAGTGDGPPDGELR